MLLVIDTATPACSIALVEEGKVMAERHELVGRGHAEKLLPMIDDMLDMRRPDAILVDCGPGSFTGIRVGLAAAHGLAIGWGIEVSGYSSLALLAATAPDGQVASALQAGHGEIFVQSFGRSPLQPLDALQSLTPAAAAQRISAQTVVGSGAQTLVDARGFGEAIDASPRAADAWLLPALLRSLAARPIYGRAPDAKPQW